MKEMDLASLPLSHVTWSKALWPDVQRCLAEWDAAVPQDGELMLLCPTTAIASALLANPSLLRHLSPTGFIVPSLALSVC